MMFVIMHIGRGLYVSYVQLNICMFLESASLFAKSSFRKNKVMTAMLNLLILINSAYVQLNALKPHLQF